MNNNEKKIEMMIEIIEKMEKLKKLYNISKTYDTTLINSAMSFINASLYLETGNFEFIEKIEEKVFKNK